MLAGNSPLVFANWGVSLLDLPANPSFQRLAWIQNALCVNFLAMDKLSSVRLRRARKLGRNDENALTNHHCRPASDASCILGVVTGQRTLQHVCRQRVQNYSNKSFVLPSSTSTRAQLRNLCCISRAVDLQTWKQSQENNLE